MGHSLNQIAGRYGAELARFFSISVLADLARCGRSDLASRLFSNLELGESMTRSLPVKDFYDTLFKELVTLYRHEYIFKNALAEKLLIGKHSLNTAYMITEFRTGNCKADAVILNGTSHAYEIKSILDGYKRLDQQLAAYTKVFDCISVVTDEEQFSQVESRIPPQVGIMALASKGYRFRKRSHYREPISNKSNTDPGAIFDVLTQAEYLAILQERMGISLKQVPNTKLYRIAKAHFTKLSPECAHDTMVSQLKARKNKGVIQTLINAAPASLKAAALSLRLKQSELAGFIRLLDQPAEQVFS